MTALSPGPAELPGTTPGTEDVWGQSPKVVLDADMEPVLTEGHTGVRQLRTR